MLQRLFIAYYASASAVSETGWPGVRSDLVRDQSMWLFSKYGDSAGDNDLNDDFVCFHG